MRTKPALRTELLFYLSFFAAAALLVGVATTAVAGPIASGAEFWLVMALVALEVGVFVVFGRYLVTRLVLRPLQHLQPSDIVQGAFTLLEAQGALKTVRPSLDVANGVPLIRARAHLLEQALVNIVLNAVDAAPGAAVVVGVRRWAYEPGHAAPRRAVDPPPTLFPPEPARRPPPAGFPAGAPGPLGFVADAGPGGQPEDRAKIFEP